MYDQQRRMWVAQVARGGRHCVCSPSFREGLTADVHAYSFNQRAGFKNIASRMYLLKNIVVGCHCLHKNVVAAYTRGPNLTDHGLARVCPAEGKYNLWVHTNFMSAASTLRYTLRFWLKPVRSSAGGQETPSGSATSVTIRPCMPYHSSALIIGMAYHSRTWSVSSLSMYVLSFTGSTGTSHPRPYHRPVPLAQTSLPGIGSHPC